MHGGGAQEADEQEGVARRDQGFDALYRRWYEPMVRVAFLLLGSLEPAEEAVHDAFAKVFERWRSIDVPEAYLRRCVVNRCRDLQRRRRLERAQAERTVPEVADLEARELLDALAGLPHRQRAALVLRFYEGLSEADTAAALGVPLGTVKSTVSRALAQLREVVPR